MISLGYGLCIPLILFTLGFLFLMIRRNLLFIFLGLEIMTNSISVAWVIIGSYWNHIDGQIMYILVISVASIEAGIALILLMNIYQRYKTLDIDILSEINK